MYNDPTCNVCHAMAQSEYGVEEPHQAHCTIEHDKGEHETMTGQSAQTFTCNCCEREYNIEDMQTVTPADIVDGKTWCDPCNTDMCTQGGFYPQCTYREYWECELCGADIDDYYYVGDDVACRSCYELEEQRDEITQLRHEQLIDDARSRDMTTDWDTHETTGECWVCGQQTHTSYLDMGWQHMDCDKFPTSDGDVTIINGVRQ